jgi:hypothetical protein
MANSVQTVLSRGSSDVQNHPLYPKWLRALEDVIRTKEALADYEENSPEWMSADADYQAALMEYDSVGKKI